MKVEEIMDPGFTEYESAIMFKLKYKDLQFSIGGVVFSGPHPGITLVNYFVCEIEADGTLLVTTNLDQPGMIGIIGMCLGRHGVNINQFELGRNVRGGVAMAIILVDEDVSLDVLE